MIAQRKSNDTKIVMSLEGTLKEKIGDEGLVENKAILLPGAPANNWKPGSGEVPPPEYPNAKVVSKFGKAKITKVHGDFGKLHADGYVDGVLVAKADFTFALQRAENLS